MSIPSPTPILDLINAFRKSKVLFSIVSLGIIDILHALGPCESNDIVHHLKLRPATSFTAKVNTLNQQQPQPSQRDFSLDAVERLLKASVSIGILEFHKSNSVVGTNTPKYSLTPLAQEYLTPNSKTPLTGYIMHSDETLFPLWTHLQTSMQTGSTTWKPAFPTLPDSQNPFKQLYSTPESRQRFLSAMHSHSALSSPYIVSAFDFSWCKHIVDLGGGTGALAIEFMNVYHNTLDKVTVVDLPEVVNVAKKVYLDPLKSLNDDGTSTYSRIEAVEGDFVTTPKDGQQDPLPRGDLYVVSRILHDWDVDTCTRLLERISNLLPDKSSARSGILIAECLLNEDGTEPVNTCLQDLNMLVQTGGRERSFNEYKQMLMKAGFRDVEFKITGSYLDAVVAFK
ncbi:hypothetical protein HDU76_001977 [Blyttiomyces sp. JEL0837]|nr:hypothetical protein HDU76_001977 [Blyttiomyces sp. JEL0837]